MKHLWRAVTDGHAHIVDSESGDQLDEGSHSVPLGIRTWTGIAFERTWQRMADCCRPVIPPSVPSTIEHGTGRRVLADELVYATTAHHCGVVTGKWPSATAGSLAP